jgi:hypothetical protein
VVIQAIPQLATKARLPSPATGDEVDQQKFHLPHPTTDSHSMVPRDDFPRPNLRTRAQHGLETFPCRSPCYNVLQVMTAALHVVADVSKLEDPWPLALPSTPQVRCLALRVTTCFEMGPEDHPTTSNNLQQSQFYQSLQHRSLRAPRPGQQVVPAPQHLDLLGIEQQSSHSLLTANIRPQPSATGWEGGKKKGNS